MKPGQIQRRYLILSAALAIVAAGFVFFYASHQKATPMKAIGMVRKTEIRIAPEVGGRLADFKVKRGDNVQAGDVLAIIDSPEIAAAVAQAEQAVVQAKAARARVYAGVRIEEVKTAEQALEKMKADAALAENQHRRARELIRQGDVSQQVFDTRDAELSTAHARVVMAEAALAQAKNGPTAEDRIVADRTVAMAEAARLAAQKHQDKLVIHAPMNGRIWTLITEIGETLLPGQPVLTLETPETWFSFNIREDMLNGMTVGSIIELKIGDGTKETARITGLQRLGDYATWRAESAVNDFDLNTFQIRADQVTEKPSTLAAGMTAWIESVK